MRVRVCTKCPLAFTFSVIRVLLGLLRASEPSPCDAGPEQVFAGGCPPWIIESSVSVRVRRRRDA